MKVGILVDEIAPGSAPKLIGWPVRKLRELGVEAEALVLVDKDHWKKFPEVYGFHLKDVPVRYLWNDFPRWLQRRDFRFPGMSFFSLHHIASWFFSHRAVKQGEFDLIIGHCQYSAFAARNLLRRRGIPFLLLLWDPSTFTAKKIYRKRFGVLYPLLYSAAWILDRFALRKCRAVITSGRFHHEHLRRLTDKPLEVLYPGCFVKESLPPFESREKIILTYDRWDIGNRPMLFLDLLEQIERDDVRLVIGGFWHPPELRKEFLSEVERRGLKDRVEMLGPLDERKIMELCSRAMIHAHLIHEAFGMQTLEAAACGCPGLMAEGSGVAEIFEDGVSGIKVPPGDIKVAAGRLRNFFADANLARRMSELAWSAANEHSWDAHARGLKSLIERYT